VEESTNLAIEYKFAYLYYEAELDLSKNDALLLAFDVSEVVGKKTGCVPPDREASVRSALL